MKTRAELKAMAKESLQGKYGDAIVITILILVISMFTGGVTGVLTLNVSENKAEMIENIIGIIIAGLFTFGYLSFFLKISRDEDVEIKELWSKTNMFATFIIASLLVSIFTFLWTLLLIIPGIIAAYSYQMTLYILLDNPDMNVMDAIKESKRLMKGHKMDYFILQLSFLGWIILGAFTVGILYLWLIPYMSVTICNFYNNLKELSE
jgi:uncharacterized membrane protein